MDSAKNKKSFPDQIPEFEPSFAPSGPQGFRLPGAFWDVVDQDPVLRAEMQRRVEQAARKILVDEAAPERERIFDEAREQGFVKGLEQGRELVESVKTGLSQTASKLLEEKHALLGAHEKLWARALVHLVRRFMVPIDGAGLERITGWVEGLVSDFREKAKVVVLVPPTLMRQLECVGGSSVASSIEWKEDPGLKPGTLSVEVAGGHLLFDSDAQWERLEQLLQEFLVSADQGASV